MRNGFVWILLFVCLELFVIQSAEPSACSDSGTYAVLDFWIGEWDVYLDGRRIGANRIEKVLNGCAVIENWRDARGGEGKSLFYYDLVSRNWKQVWVTGAGSMKEKSLKKVYPDHSVLFQGTVTLPGGEQVYDRTALSPVGEEVRQVIEQSADEGKTWKTVFDGLYRRKPESISEFKAQAENLVDRYIDSWLKGNADGVMEVFDEDAVLLPHHGGDPIKGEAAIRAFWWPADSPPTVVNSFHMTLEEVRAEGSIGFARGHFELEWSSGERTVRNKGTYILLFRRNEGSAWKITHYMWDDPPV